MSCILCLFWPGCMWATITKALRRGPQGPFTQWRNVCALMAPHSSRVQPLSGAPAQLTTALCKAVATPHCVFYHCKQPAHKGEKKSKGWGGREKDEKQKDLMPRVLVAFHKGASIPAPLEGKRRGGWRVGVHSSLLMPWRGIGFGCRTRNEGKPKPLQTRRPRLANALLAIQQAGQRVLWVHHLPQLQDLTDQKGSLVHSTWMYHTKPIWTVRISVI